MAASDEFPRGSFESANAGNNAVTTIVIPASAGIAHVLDAWSVVVVNGTTSGGSTVAVLLTTSDGSYTNYELGLITFGPGTATQNGLGSDDDTPGLILAAGASATISVQNGGAFCSSLLRLRWHDI